MRSLRYVAGAAVFALLPAVSAAQGTSQTTGGTTDSPPTTVTTRADQDTGFDWLTPRESHWIGSAFVGSNFAQDAEEASLDFGGSVGYLWRGVLGAEFQANFSPDFDLEPGRNALLLGNQPWINSYMVNAVGALPMGDEGRWQPYVSGGLGALTLHSETLFDTDDNQFDPDATRMGANIGFGLMGFVRNVGIRGDVRYFNGFEADSNDLIGDPGDTVGDAVLSNLNFWRANIGVAFRW